MSIESAGDPKERSATAPATTGAVVPAEETAPSKGFSIGSLLRRDLGQFPVFIGFIAIVIYFQIAGQGYFLTAQNLSNLALQIVTTTILAVAAVLVLLIAEIDLSLSAVAYFCGAFMGVLSARQGWSAPAAILAGLLAGVVIGLVNGFFVAVVRMPSFIVTLAGFIGYQGLLSRILEPQTTLPIRDSAITSIAVTYLPLYLGATLPALALLLYVGGIMLTRARRARAGLPVQSVGQLALQVGIPIVLTAVVVIAFESYQGVPLMTMITVGIIVLFWLLTTKTEFGRHIYAVGGNAEASRRAGIRVVGLRIAIFTLASTLAAVGGILNVSRQVSAPAQLDQTLLLNAIAAAVIGGVSLFGGRGSVWGVVLGALIVGSLINGLALTGQPASVELMAEGVVLLLAVLIDALARRRNVTGYR
ncbi:MAG TPA: inner-membrane translocator [Ktedonobacterales bacterium]